MTYDNWFPTAELRFERREWRDGGHAMASNVLQQKWRVYPADASITRDEWRDVPLVTEGA